MKEIIINVDSYNENSIKTIEGDNLSEVYKIYILKNKRRIDLTNKIAIMAYVNEYGSKKSNILALNITNASEGEIELPITNVISQENGLYACQIAIYGENNSLEQTAPFNLIVENNIFSKISSDAVNSNDFQILSEAIKTTNEYSEKLKQGTENIELQYADKLNELDSKMPEKVNISDGKLMSKTAQIYENAINSTPIFNLKKSLKKINNGSIKIAFVGDSITEGADQVYLNEIWVNKVIRELKKNTNCTFNFMNFALSGRMITQINDRSYKAVNPEPNDKNLGFWRDWATVGKAWIDHIKDYQPDLLVIGFGMNDAFGDCGKKEYLELNKLESEIKSWGNIPDLIVIPCYLPTSDTKEMDKARFTQTQLETLDVSRATRIWAKNKGYAIADANRLFRILRDGVDECITETYVKRGFDDFKDYWWWNTDNYNVHDNYIRPINANIGSVIKTKKKFNNSLLEVDIIHSKLGDEGAASIRLRSNDFSNILIQVIAGNDDGKVLLYSDYRGNATPIDGRDNLNIPLTGVRLKIESIDDKHYIYLNNSLLFSTNSLMSNFSDGMIEFGGDNTSPTFGNLIIHERNLIKTNPIYSNYDLFGSYPPLYITAGNGINHPSTICGELVMYNSFKNIIKCLNTEKLPLTSTNFKVLNTDFKDSVSPFPLTTTEGKPLFYYAFDFPYNAKNNGISIKYKNTLLTLKNSNKIEDLKENEFIFYIDENSSLLWVCGDDKKDLDVYLNL